MRACIHFNKGLARRRTTIAAAATAAIMIVALAATMTPMASAGEDDYGAFLERLRQVRHDETMEGQQTAAVGDADTPVVSVVAPIAPTPGSIPDAYVPDSGNAASKTGIAISPSERARADLKERLANNRLTINLSDADLHSVIRGLALKGNLNLIIPPNTARTKITVYLDDVPILTAMESILKANELTYIVEDSGILRIAPLSRVQASDKPEMATIHIPLNWIKATDLVLVLKEIVEDFDGKVTAESNSNAVIISAPPPTLEDMRDIIAKLDIPDKQVDIEARFYEMTDDATRDLGMSWSIFRADDTGNSPDQVSGGGPANSAHSNLFGTISSLAARGGVWNYGTVFDMAGKEYNLGAQLRAYETDGKARTLANPRLTTLNNVPADINLVTEEPYEEVTFNETGGQEGKKETEDVGIKMTVLPNITNNGFVKLNITAEQTILAGYTELRLTGRVPVISRRMSDTNIIVEDEKTAALFGLREQTSFRSTYGIPWLRRIPFFGWLFKENSDTQAKLNLACFITPHILKTPNLTDDQIQMYDAIDLNWHLPDYFFDDVALPGDKRGSNGDPRF